MYVIICHRYLDQKVGKALLSLLPSDILLSATLFKLSSTWSRTWSTCAEVAQAQDSLDDIPAALSRSHCRSARLLDSSLVSNTSIDPFKSSLIAVSVCIRRRLQQEPTLCHSREDWWNLVEHFAYLTSYIHKRDTCHFDAVPSPSAVLRWLRSHLSKI